MPLVIVTLYDSRRAEVCDVEIVSVTPPWELIWWRTRHFLWHAEENKYVECSVFCAVTSVRKELV